MKILSQKCSLWLGIVLSCVWIGLGVGLSAQGESSSLNQGTFSDEVVVQSIGVAGADSSIWVFKGDTDSSFWQNLSSECLGKGGIEIQLFHPDGTEDVYVWNGLNAWVDENGKTVEGHVISKGTQAVCLNPSLADLTFDFWGISKMENSVSAAPEIVKIESRSDTDILLIECLNSNVKSIGIIFKSQESDPFYTVLIDSMPLSGSVAVPKLNGNERFYRVVVTDSWADADGDGLSDGLERLVYGTDPLNGDTDGDGMNDAEEVESRTDPHVQDTDKDGFTDFDEIHKYGTDPLNALSNPRVLPNGWSVENVGSPTLQEAPLYYKNMFELACSGVDVWDGNDQIQWVSTSADGDFDLKCKVTALENSRLWTRAGIMVRDHLRANSANVFLCLTGSNGVKFQKRNETGSGYSEFIAEKPTSAYLRLTRTGGVFYAYTSSDGVNWGSAGSTTANIRGDARVGFALCATGNNRLCRMKVEILSFDAFVKEPAILEERGTASAWGSEGTVLSVNGKPYTGALKVNANETVTASAVKPPQQNRTAKRWIPQGFTYGMPLRFVNISGTTLPPWDAAVVGCRVVREFNAPLTSGKILNGFNAENWGFKTSGKLYVPESRVYTFSLTADDGAEIELEGQPLLKTRYAADLVTTQLFLNEGLHDLRIRFVQGRGQQSFVWTWEAEGFEKRAVGYPYLLSADADNDGLADDFELIRYGNLTASDSLMDSDNDGRTDADEMTRYGSDFLVADAPALTGSKNTPADLYSGFCVRYYNWAEKSVSMISKLGNAYCYKVGAEKSLVFMQNRISLPEPSGKSAYSARFDGYLSVPERGTYTFYTVSDDASAVLLNGRVVLLNDGTHGMEAVSANTALEAGTYPVSVLYTQMGGTGGLIAEWSGPNLPRRILGTPFVRYSKSFMEDIQLDPEGRGGDLTGSVFEPNPPPSGVTTERVLTLDGLSFSGDAAGWVREDSSAVCYDRQGKIDYRVQIDTAGAYRLNIQTSQRFPGTTLKRFVLELSVDGVVCSTVVCDGNGVGEFWIPKLSQGQHVLTLRWKNMVACSIMAIDAAVLERCSGADINANGIPDEVEQWLNNSGKTFVPPMSFVSPLCVEGVTDGTMQQIAFEGFESDTPFARKLPGRGWFANVPLKERGVTDFNVRFNNNGITLAKSCEWATTYLFDFTDTPFYIRAGDSLKFNTLRDTAPFAEGEISVNGLKVKVSGDSDCVVKFDHPGIYTVSGTHAGRSSQMKIYVYSGQFTPTPVLLTNTARDWENPNLEKNLTLENDPGLGMLSLEAQKGSKYRLFANSAGNFSAAVRLYAGGPVLDVVTVKVISMLWETRGTGTAIYTFPDGSELVEGKIQLSDIPKGFSVKICTWTPGIFMENGSQEMTFTAEDVDANGILTYRIIRMPNAATGNCHYIRFFDNGQLIYSSR